MRRRVSEIADIQSPTDIHSLFLNEPTASSFSSLRSSASCPRYVALPNKLRELAHELLPRYASTSWKEALSLIP
jgi:hypothetical protein